MDMMTDDFFDTSAEKGNAPSVVSLPFPQIDYKNGNLKRVRGRMLKKLLKYEYKYALPYLLVAAGVLIFASLLLGVQIFSLQKSDTASDTPLFMLSIILYIYANLAVLIMPIGMAERRFAKHFFGSEGALTLSIPASAEEHILAKHIAVITALAIALGAILIGTIVLGCFTGVFLEITKGVFQGIGQAFKAKPLLSLAFTLEGLIFFAEVLVLLPCACGAFSCLMQKYTDKKRFGVTLLVVFVVMFSTSACETLFLTSSAVQLLQTVAGMQLLVWLVLLINAGLISLCIWFELRTLKYNVNLK